MSIKIGIAVVTVIDGGHLRLMLRKNINENDTETEYHCGIYVMICLEFKMNSFEGFVCVKPSFGMTFVSFIHRMMFLYHKYAH